MRLPFNKRETIIVASGSLFVLVWIYLQFVFWPLKDTSKRLTRTISAKESIHRDILELKNEYHQLKSQAEAANAHFKNQDKNFTLFSFLDKLAGQIGIKGNIIYMKPSTSTPKDMPYKLAMVEMKLQGLNLTQLTDYLYGVETSANQMYIKRLAITQKSQESKSVDVVLQVETIQF